MDFIVLCIPRQCHNKRYIYSMYNTCTFTVYVSMQCIWNVNTMIHFLFLTQTFHDIKEYQHWKKKQLYQHIEDNGFFFYFKYYITFFQWTRFKALSIDPDYNNNTTQLAFLWNIHNLPTRLMLPSMIMTSLHRTPTLQTFRCINLDLPQEMNWK